MSVGETETLKATLMNDPNQSYAELHRAPVEKLGDLGWRSGRCLEEGSYVTASRAADLLSTREYGTHDELGGLG